jgi:hypothetical protein
MASSVSPSASRAAVALVEYADFVDILILVVRDAVTDNVEEAFYELRLCRVAHGSRRAGSLEPALLLVALADVGYAFSDRTLWYYRRSSPLLPLPLPLPLSSSPLPLPLSSSPLPLPLSSSQYSLSTAFAIRKSPG